MVLLEASYSRLLASDARLMKAARQVRLAMLHIEMGAEISAVHDLEGRDTLAVEDIRSLAPEQVTQLLSRLSTATRASSQSSSSGQERSNAREILCSSDTSSRRLQVLRAEVKAHNLHLQAAESGHTIPGLRNRSLPLILALPAEELRRFRQELEDAELELEDIRSFTDRHHDRCEGIQSELRLLQSDHLAQKDDLSYVAAIATPSRVVPEVLLDHEAETSPEVCHRIRLQKQVTDKALKDLQEERSNCHLLKPDLANARMNLRRLAELQSEVQSNCSPSPRLRDEFFSPPSASPCWEDCGQFV